MGAVDTTYTFTATDTITSSKMNNIIDQTTMTSDAIIGTTLEVASGKLKVRAGGITSNEMATGSVTSNAILNGAVTQAKTSNMLVPAGAVMAFAMNSAPTGWLAADGSAISRTTYATLFAAIGTTHGTGDNSTTFNVPDLRGYFVRGSGTNGDGTASGTFGAKQTDALQNITGTVATFANGSLGGNWHVEPQTADGAFYNTASSGSMTTGGGGAGAGYVNVVFDASRVARTSTETRPVNIAMLYCIKI